MSAQISSPSPGCRRQWPRGAVHAGHGAGPGPASQRMWRPAPQAGPAQVAALWKQMHHRWTQAEGAPAVHQVVLLLKRMLQMALTQSIGLGAGA